MPLLTVLTLIPALVQGAPTSVPSPASGRELIFAGFNLLPLKASVLPGQGPLLAVMVADSGPTDRNWSNPLFPKGQAGRDFALWLQKQGIGSLRFDKRFIGSRDPKLDISLDAQAGDIRAALKAARSLPEAQGKKLLLIGHGEGALLGLLAAAEADALLLIGLPGQSMAKTIQAQVSLQLPPESAASNLAYLERVFEAIRKGRSTPEGGLEIYPSLEDLARRLMRLESLDFVRATLDLNPWALLARVSVPCALVWGDRDVQTPKPESIPGTYQGTVLVLPESNHFLRRETRPRAELDGAMGMSGYGGDTPMSDLGAMAAWLKRIQ